MKKTLITFLLLVVSLSSCIQRQEAETGNEVSAKSVENDVEAPIISYTENKHDLGTINTTEGGHYVFHYSNKGAAPLIVSDVLTSCGCITKEWHDAPLNAGESDSIVLHIRSKALGRLQKAIVVKNNSANEPILTIRLEGFVVE